MRKILEKMVSELRKQVEEKVPEKGEFPVVFEREEVSDMKIGLSHLILKVTGVGLDGHEDERYLELGAVNYPSPYGAESVMAFGSTQKILSRLQDPQLVDELMAKTKKLADDIDYEERHPWG